MEEKRFTIVVSGPSAKLVTDNMLRNSIRNRFVGSIDIKVWEHNKTHHCDGCGKERRDVQSWGRDSNGDPDAPDLCFICRKEATRGRTWDSKLNRYVNFIDLHKDEVPF